MSELGEYELPMGWRWSTIPELVGNNGVFIDGDWVESKDQDPDGDVRLIQLADVGDGVYRDKSARFMTKAKAKELRCTFLQKDDVLIARMPDPLGRACIFPGDDKPSVTVVDVAIARSGNGEFDHRWLACFVNAHPFRAAISGLQAGSTRKRISRGNLGTIPLPVPPLKEQRRIVAEIEKQFTRLDAGVAALRRTQANLNRYRAAVLKAACEGRLVPPEADLAKQQYSKRGSVPRGRESGAMLLERILTERRKNWNGRGKYEEPTRPDVANLPTLPDGWSWARLEQVGVTYGGLTKNPKRAKLPKQLPYLRVANVYANELRLEEIEYIGVADAEFTKLLVRKGDLLIVEGNGSKDQIGRLAIWDGSIESCVHQNHLIKVRPVEARMSKWILHWLQSPGGRQFVELVASSTSGLFTLSVSKVGNLPIPVPPLAEQTRIVAEVERRLSVVEELETVVSANLRRATRLRQSILQWAFSDESAKSSGQPT